MATWSVTAAGSELSIGGDLSYKHYDIIPVDSAGLHHLFVRGELKVQNVGNAAILEVNDSTWAVTLEGTLCEFCSTDIWAPKVCKVTDNYCLVLYLAMSGSNYVVKAQLLNINTSTWAVTTAGSVFVLANIGSGGDIYKSGPTAVEMVDATHALCSWVKYGADWDYMRVVEVNVGAETISFAGASFSFGVDGWDPYVGFGLVKLDDSGHWAVSWMQDRDPQIRVFEIDGNYDLSWSGSQYEINSLESYGLYRNLHKIDATHLFQILYVYDYDYLFCYVFNVDTSTWAITLAQNTYIPPHPYTTGISSVSMLDSKHFQLTWKSGDSPTHSFTQIIELSHSTWETTKLQSAVDIQSAGVIHYTRCSQISIPGSNGYTLIGYRYGTALRVKVFQVEGPSTARKYLNFFAHAAGTEYKFLGTEARASLVALKDLLTGIEQIRYGNYSTLSTDVKAAGIAYKYLKAEIAEINNEYTKFFNLLSEAGGAEEIFRFFNSEIKAALIGFRRLSSVIGAKYLLDTDIPYLKYDFYPSDNAQAISPYSPILMKIADVGMGVKLDTFFCKVNGVQYNYGDSEVKVYPLRPPFEYLFAVKPGFLGWNKEATVDVYCEDKYGNPGLKKEIL